MPVSEVWKLNDNRIAYKLASPSILFEYNQVSSHVIDAGDWLLTNRFMEIISLSDEVFTQLMSNEPKTRIS